jgi:hypothetical protein
MTHVRYLVLSGPFVVERHGTLTEAHKAIMKRAPKVGMRPGDYVVVDTWTEPGAFDAKNLTWSPA